MLLTHAHSIITTASLCLQWYTGISIESLEDYVDKEPMSHSSEDSSSDDEDVAVLCSCLIVCCFC